MPLHWGKNQPGMKAKEEHNAPVNMLDHMGRFEVIEREEAWKVAMRRAVVTAQSFANAGYHKQIVNRLLEPFSHINVLVTSTEWDNFFELRDHPDAQPEIRTLAVVMRASMDSSTPDILQEDQWHLPYITAKERRDAYYGPSQTPAWNTLIRCSVARCARVSYFTHEGKPPNIEDDLKLYDRLVGARPLHASPAEHQARPVGLFEREKLSMTGNFKGWIQYRKLLEIEMARGT